MSSSIETSPPRRGDADRSRDERDLFADDPFDRPLTPPAESDDWPSADRPLASETRRKRRVIVDDAYGWDQRSVDGAAGDAPPADPFAADPEGDPVAAPTVAKRLAAGGATRRGGDQLPAPLIDPVDMTERGGRGVWWGAILASLVWIGGVAAFSVGYFRLPIDDFGALLFDAQRLDVKIQFMIAAAAVAPLGLIWMHALNARRARALAADARRLTRLASKISAAAAAPGPLKALPADGPEVDPHALRLEAENASRALDALESKFAAAEKRAQTSREKLEAEREHLAKLVRELEGEAARVEKEADRFRAASGLLDSSRREAAGVAGLDPEQLKALAGMIATAMGPAAAAREATGFQEGPAPLSRRDAPPREAGARKPDFDDRAPRGADAREPDLREPGLRDPDLREPALREPDLRSSDPRLDDRRYGAVAAGADRMRDRSPERAASALDWEKFVKAANFPDSEDDRETLEALYAVLTDREAAALLQTAEDVLSTLADLNLFMEDMQVHHAPIELWRSYIIDGDSRDILDIGGVRDPHAIEDVEFALNERQEFARISKAFFDQYETIVARLFQETDDPTLAVELADTRTGRAYMLIGRAEGRFGE